MKKISEMGLEEIRTLSPQEIDRLLQPEEVLHLAKALGAFWSYDYEAGQQGRPGLHALLKSGRHSDGFFVSRILLEPLNIRRLMAEQIVRRLKEVNMFPMPEYVAGIPDGAALLGEEVAAILGAKQAKMEKVDGQLKFLTDLKPGETILLVEDFCTRGTGFTEAIQRIVERQPQADIIPLDPVILNRGGLESIIVENVGIFAVVPIVELRVNDWEGGPETCPLCRLGSQPIKPKATEENWRAIVNSQH